MYIFPLDLSPPIFVSARASSPFAGSDVWKLVPEVSVIDDDEPVRTSLARLLRLHGFLPDAFASAEDFLRSPSLTGSDCLIVDVQMPGMSGLELQEHLSAQGNRLPVIFITAFATRETEAKARAAGSVCLLRKPFAAGALIDCVREALTRGDRDTTRA